MSIEAKVTIILTIVAIIVSLFTTSIRRWIVGLFRKLHDYFQLYPNNILFRSLFLLLLDVFVLVLLYSSKIIISLGVLVSFLVFSIILFLEFYLISLPILFQISNLKSEIKMLKAEVEVLNSAKRIELENIQSRWPEFIKSLADKPGFHVVSAFLQASKPVHIEKDTLLISVPDVVYEVSEGINVEKLTPQFQDFFGTTYKTRLTVLKSR